MKVFDGQTIVAIICVAIALAALSRRAVLWWNGQSDGGCGGGCHGCSTTVRHNSTVPLKVLLPVIHSEPPTHVTKS